MNYLIVFELTAPRLDSPHGVLESGLDRTLVMAAVSVKSTGTSWLTALHGTHLCHTSSSIAPVRSLLDQSSPF